MNKIAWVKVNRIMQFQTNREEAKRDLQKKYKISFPIYRQRSPVKVVRLNSYGEIIDEYATSGESTLRKFQLLTIGILSRPVDTLL